MTYEVWKIVPSIPGIEASSLGRIRLLPYESPMPHGGTRMYIGKPTYGYRVRDSGLMIYRCKRLKKTVKIAQCVCEAFHGAPFDRAVAMHVDDDPTNNEPINLVWELQKRKLQ